MDFYVLLGDFNGNMNSSVNRYLLGDQTVNGHESNLYWDDIDMNELAIFGTEIYSDIEMTASDHYGFWKVNCYPEDVSGILLFAGQYPQSIPGCGHTIECK